jgi:hypothetical protein
VESIAPQLNISDDTVRFSRHILPHVLLSDPSAGNSGRYRGPRASSSPKFSCLPHRQDRRDGSGHGGRSHTPPTPHPRQRQPFIYPSFHLLTGELLYGSRCSRGAVRSLPPPPRRPPPRAAAAGRTAAWSRAAAAAATGVGAGAADGARSWIAGTR